jgi:heat shock protein HslJ
MKRRSLLAAFGSGLFTGVLVRGRAPAKDATPAAGGDDGVAVIRWELQRIASGNGATTPDDPSRYWFQLLPDGTAAIQADCNQVSGAYVLEDSSLSFGDLVTTDMTCGPESIGEEFVRNLGYVVAFTRTTNGSDELVLDLMADGGQLTFAPALPGVVWEWAGFEGGDGSVVTASDPSRYSIEFLEDGTVQVLADCNSGTGTAAIDEPGIDITVATTRMACPDGSQDADFLRYLDEAVSYVIRDGHLALSLPMDAGIALFRPAIPEITPATPVH